MAKCQECGNDTSYFEIVRGRCAKCHFAANREDEAAGEALTAGASKIILTTESAHDFPIAERLEIISAECVLGMNIFNDFGSAVRDMVGGRNQTYQAKLREARKTVLDELKREAHSLGADAVVAVDLDYSEISGAGKSMLFVVATGTAVRLGSAPKLA